MANKDLDKYYNALDRLGMSNCNSLLLCTHRLVDLPDSSYSQGFNEVPHNENGGNQQNYKRVVATNISRARH